MTSNFQKDDPVQGSIDLDEEYITDAWLIDNYVGNALFACGYGTQGQLGSGSQTSVSTPIQIGSSVSWKQVSSGPEHTIALKNDGTLWAWGSNNTGQLGNGTRTYYSSPIQVGALTNWKQIDSHDANGVIPYGLVGAIKTDGTLWTWGDNIIGMLGNGTQTAYSSPIQIGALTNWKTISCGYSFMAAIKNDGTMWGWGGNQYGQLGNGTTSYYSSPIQIGALTTWKRLSSGGNSHRLAIKTDGTLWATGQNNFGQLGNGNNVYYSSPIQIGSLTNWKYVECGASISIAIKTDGTLWVWGATGSASGYSGIGVLAYYSSPVQIGALTNWKYVSIGQQTGFAVKTDGTLWAWGDNGSVGNLGMGSATAKYSSPIQVGSLTRWKQVSQGLAHFIGITYTDIT